MAPTNDDHVARTLHPLAARVAVATLVVLGILAVVAVLWVGRIVVALLFLAIVIASAIRPSVEALKRRRVPRPQTRPRPHLVSEGGGGTLVAPLYSACARVRARELMAVARRSPSFVSPALGAGHTGTAHSVPCLRWQRYCRHGSRLEYVEARWRERVRVHLGESNRRPLLAERSFNRG
jgi:hypothetical protein